jgi:hypothetical protein
MFLETAKDLRRVPGYNRLCSGGMVLESSIAACPTKYNTPFVRVVLYTHGLSGVSWSLPNPFIGAVRPSFISTIGVT